MGKFLGAAVPGKKDLYFAVIVVVLTVALAFVSGFFFGSYDQIIKSKSRLEVVTDVNCGKGSLPLL